MPPTDRRTKIVATIGPASRDPETLKRMVDAGMDVARLNFSHGSREIHAENAQRIRQAAGEAGRQVAILQDLPGPKIRIGRLKDDVAELKPGERLVLVCGSDQVGDEQRISVSWRGLTSAVDPGDVIYLADGAIRLRVMANSDSEVETAVEIGGAVASRQGINLPGSTRGLPAVPEEDLELLRFGESIGVDLVALSFVRTAEDVTSVRRHTRLPLVAKIEKPQAVDSAEEIIRAADCVMVARGPGDRARNRRRTGGPEAAASDRGTVGAPVDHRHPDARLDGFLEPADACRGGRRRQRDPRRHRCRDALPGDGGGGISGGSRRDDGVDCATNRA
jgi:pyruvate kinase